MNYDLKLLKTALQQQQWHIADKETAQIMLLAASRITAGWLDKEHIKNLLCITLQTLNNLWMEHSDNHFGLTIQKQIYEQGCQSLIRFVCSVAWYDADYLAYHDLNFSLQAPAGHLPAWIYWGRNISIDRGYRGYRRISFMLHELLCHRANDCYF